MTIARPRHLYAFQPGVFQPQGVQELMTKQLAKLLIPRVVPNVAWVENVVTRSVVLKWMDVRLLAAFIEFITFTRGSASRSDIVACAFVSCTRARFMLIFAHQKTDLYTARPAGNSARSPIATRECFAILLS
jgi:hypothetical protein